jgi:hypothetical protein
VQRHRRLSGSEILENVCITPKGLEELKSVKGVNWFGMRRRSQVRFWAESS